MSGMKTITILTVLFQFAFVAGLFGVVVYFMTAHKKKVRKDI